MQRRWRFRRPRDMRIRWLAAAAGCMVLAPVLAGCASAGTGPGGAPAVSSVATATATPFASISARGTPGPPAPCPSSGSRQRQPGRGTALTGVQFVSAQQGWVVGGDRILATGDGGAHWQIQDRGRLGLSSVDFINASDGWAVGLSTVLATTDGGAHWKALPEPCPPIDAVHFVSGSRGFAVAGGTVTSYQPVPATGGVLLTTRDGGRTWTGMYAPADVQSACFTDPAHGWLGAHGHLYRTVNGGTTWALATAGVTGQAGQPFSMTVQCAGPDVWALDLGTGAAMNHAPVIGFHGSPSGAKPLFAEQYFPHPGVSVKQQAPGTYPGPMSAISPGTAVVIGWCPPCGYGTVPWDLLTRSGSAIAQHATITGLTQATGASFLTPQLGWVIGTADDYRNPAHQIQRQRIVMTTDGGASWQTQYSFLP